MATAVSDAVDELEQLDTADTLQDAFEESDACTELRREVSELG